MDKVVLLTQMWALTFLSVSGFYKATKFYVAIQTNTELFEWNSFILLYHLKLFYITDKYSVVFLVLLIKGGIFSFLFIKTELLQTVERTL